MGKNKKGGKKRKRGGVEGEGDWREIKLRFFRILKKSLFFFVVGEKR